MKELLNGCSSGTPCWHLQPQNYHELWECHYRFREDSRVLFKVWALLPAVSARVWCEISDCAMKVVRKQAEYSNPFCVLQAFCEKVFSSQTDREPGIKAVCGTPCPAEGSVSRDTADGFFFSFLQYGCLQGQQFTSLDADCSFHLAYKLCFAPTELKSVHLLHLGTVSSFQQQRHWFGTTQPWNREVIFPTSVHNALYPSNFEESLWSVPDGWLGRKCEHGPY